MTGLISGSFLANFGVTVSGFEAVASGFKCRSGFAGGSGSTTSTWFSGFLATGFGVSGFDFCWLFFSDFSNDETKFLEEISVVELWLVGDTGVQGFGSTPVVVVDVFVVDWEVSLDENFEVVDSVEEESLIIISPSSSEDFIKSLGTWSWIFVEIMAIKIQAF